jgi:hypothetical protein
MKKLPLLYLSLFILSFSLCQAQDTLVFIKGGRQVVKISYVGYAGEKIIYSIPPSDNEMYVSRDKVWYIKYANGSIYTIKQVVNAEDTAKLPIVNLAFNAGGSSPLGGYGSSFNNPYDNEWAGFARGGITANLTLNFRLGREGASFTFMCDLIHHPFDVAELLNENPYLMNEKTGYFLNAPVFHYNGLAAYNHYAFLGGFTKTWYNSSKRTYVGLRFLAGAFFFNFPKLSGTCITQVTNSSNQTINYDYNWNTNNQINSEGVMQFGLVFGEYLTKHWNLFESVDFLLGMEGSRFFIAGQVTDSNGNSIADFYPNFSSYLAMFNYTAGIAYTFGR